MASTPTDTYMRFSGIVAYTDGSVDTFCTTLVNGQTYTHPNSLEVFRQLWVKNQATVQAVLNTLGTITLTPGQPTVVKSIKDFTIEAVGHVTHDDGSHGTFGAVVHTNNQSPAVISGKATPVIQIHTEAPATTSFSKAVSNTKQKANIKSALEKAVGTGKVSI